MIIRKEQDRGFAVLGQTDHSRFVGQLAAHWGNDKFATPAPYDSVVRAATYHDYGWLRYETDPEFDETTGQPYPFLQVPLSSKQMNAYQWSLDWMADIDPYSGLIVNTHRTGLWKRRYGTITHPAGYNVKELNPEIEAFIARNEDWQKTTRAKVDDGKFWTNYRLMQVWDLMGLYFCCQNPYDDYIEPVPTGYGKDGETGVRITMKPAGASKVALDPFPFDIRPCPVQLSIKRLPARTFANKDAFHRAYFQAPVEILEFELV
jgi:Protein of unknown function (DUF3891)